MSRAAGSIVNRAGVKTVRMLIKGMGVEYTQTTMDDNAVQPGDRVTGL